MDCQQILKAANAHDRGYVTLSQYNIDALIRAGFSLSSTVLVNTDMELLVSTIAQPVEVLESAITVPLEVLT